MDPQTVDPLFKNIIDAAVHQIQTWRQYRLVAKFQIMIIMMIMRMMMIKIAIIITFI